MYKIMARRRGSSFSKRPDAQPSMIELLQNLEEILRGVRHHIRILPKPGSKCKAEIAKADHLDPSNYDTYLFDGRAYYATNETSSSIMVMSDYNSMKLQGGGGSMFVRAR